MNGYPFTFTGFDGVRYRASYDPAGTRSGHLNPSRVVVRRVDGAPVLVAGTPYKAGYVAGHGDAFAESYRDSIRKDPTSDYRAEGATCDNRGEAA